MQSPRSNGLLSDISALAEQVPTSPQVQNQTTAAATVIPYWTGVLIPRTIAQGTCLPVIGTDWNSYFDATDNTNPKYPFHVLTVKGELNSWEYYEPGDLRYKMAFDCPSPQKVSVSFMFGGTSTAPAQYEVQITLNGKMTGYTSALNSLSQQVLTFEFLQGRNTLSIAKKLGTQVAYLATSFLGDFATFVKG